MAELEADNAAFVRDKGPDNCTDTSVEWCIRGQDVGSTP